MCVCVCRLMNGDPNMRRPSEEAFGLGMWKLSTYSKGIQIPMARSLHLIITMKRWIRTKRLSRKNSPSLHLFEAVSVQGLDLETL